MEQFSSPRVHGVTLDPVCGSTLDVLEAIGPVVYRGGVYHFCSNRCQSQFFANRPLRALIEPRLVVSFLK